MDSEDRQKAGVFCSSCLSFVGILLFAISWSSVEPTEWGLKYNSISKNIDNTTGKIDLLRNDLIDRFLILHKIKFMMVDATSLESLPALFTSLVLCKQSSSQPAGKPMVTISRNQVVSHYVFYH